MILGDKTWAAEVIFRPLGLSLTDRRNNRIVIWRDSFVCDKKQGRLVMGRYGIFKLLRIGKTPIKTNTNIML